MVIEVDRIKQDRRESMQAGGWEKLNAAMDTAGRTLRKIVVGKPKQNTVPARSA